MRKIPTRLRGANICTSSARFPPRFVRQSNYPNCTQMVRNTPKQSIGSNGVDRVHSLKKFRCDFVARTFALVRLVFHRDSLGNQTVLIAPKSSETHQNMSLGSNGVDRVRSLRKIPTRLRGTNICTSSARFPPRFVGQANCPNRTQMV